MGGKADCGSGSWSRELVADGAVGAGMVVMIVVEVFVADVLVIAVLVTVSLLLLL